MDKMLGTIVSEEEAAKALGYADVFEMRRAGTEQGRQIEELKYSLSQAKQDADRFQWGM